MKRHIAACEGNGRECCEGCWRLIREGEPPGFMAPLEPRADEHGCANFYPRPAAHRVWKKLGWTEQES